MKPREASIASLHLDVKKPFRDPGAFSERRLLRTLNSQDSAPGGRFRLPKRILWTDGGDPFQEPRCNRRMNVLVHGNGTDFCLRSD